MQRFCFQRKESPLHVKFQEIRQRIVHRQHNVRRKNTRGFCWKDYEREGAYVQWGWLMQVGAFLKIIIYIPR